MRFHYDKNKDALSIRFGEHRYAESEEMEPGVIFDYDKQRKIIGIEILNASQKLSPSFHTALLKNKIPASIGISS